MVKDKFGTRKTRKQMLNSQPEGRSVQIGPNVMARIPSVTGGKSPAMDFSHALMSGDPKATQMIEQAMGEKAKNTIVVGKDRIQILDDPFHVGDDEPSLADQFIASTYGIPKMMGLPAREAKILEPYLNAYRQDVQHAHRFALDDDFTRYAAEIASTIPAEKLLARLQYATLPYDVTWIEYNLRVKQRILRRAHGLNVDNYDWSYVSRRLGVLLHRLNDTDAVCQVICEFSDRPVLTVAMTAYYFSLSEHTWESNAGERVSGCIPMLDEDWRREKFAQEMPDDKAERMQHMTRASLWGYSEAGDAGMLQSIGDLFKLRVPSFLERHGELGYSRMYQGMAKILGPSNMEGVNSAMAHEITEFAGTMRWVVTVLAMLNQVPRLATRISRQGHIRVGLTGRRRLMDYHRLTLRLPKTNPVKFIERHLRNAPGTRHRAHEVRAHWRTYLHEVRCKIDEHQWIYDYNEGYRLCEKCEAFGRLIHEHVRGDPSLGWVDKTYVVKKDRKAEEPDADDTR